MGFEVNSVFPHKGISEIVLDSNNGNEPVSVQRVLQTVTPPMVTPLHEQELVDNALCWKNHFLMGGSS